MKARRREPQDPDRLMVMSKRCAECLFSSAALVAQPEIDMLVARCQMTGEAFECHEATLMGKQGICRAFYDQELSLVIILGKKLGRVDFVGPWPEVKAESRKSKLKGLHLL